jgi:tRNA dimethylallyltransferase
VYRGLDVATAKPGPSELARVPHHLVSHVDPRRDYTLADYVRDADEAIAEIAARGAVPIVAGGTGMYLRGLLRGVVDAPARDPELRERLRRLATRFGTARLHRLLARCDPESARRLPPRDAQRVVRALEIAFAGGARWSERLREAGSWSSGVERYPSLKVVLDLPREVLAARLDARVDGFFARGLVAEVRDLLASGIPGTANAFKAIGYREVVRALAEGIDPASVVEEVRRATRRYAKRQRTWFRGERDALRLDGSPGVEATVRTILECWSIARS